MSVFKGTGVSQGIALGKAFVVNKEDINIPKHTVQDISAEIIFFENTIKKAEKELEKLYAEAQTKLNSKDAEVFSAHLTILCDEFSIINPIKEKISNRSLNAVNAIEDHMEDVAQIFLSSGDEYMSARAADIRDVKNALLRSALGISSPDFSAIEAGSIIVADDLTPSDTIKMNLDNVSGFVSEKGGATSHTTIIARNLSIPSVVGVKDLSVIKTGDSLIIDGNSGEIILNPSIETKKQYKKKLLALKEEKEFLEKYIAQPSITKDFAKKLIKANIGSVKEAQTALSMGAEGIGLFRSEFLFLHTRTLPSEEEQFNNYKKVLEIMGGRPVTIRTLDVGGDKELPSLNLEKEENPFMGYRAIRICLDRADIFKPQLKALLRASLHGNLKIMFPMIATMEELYSAKAVLEECKQELIEEKKEFGNPKIGMMVEIPSAAVLADKFAKEVDFFSIGSNDLIQYTVAADRGNEKISNLYSHYNPAVLLLINNVIKAAHKNSIECSMCGEMAGDLLLMPLLIGMGLEEFSMSASIISKARHLMSQIDFSKFQAIHEDILHSYNIKEKLGIIYNDITNI